MRGIEENKEGVPTDARFGRSMDAIMNIQIKIILMTGKSAQSRFLKSGTF
jgi:hypothetical protein